MRIYKLELKTFDFDALLNFIPNRPEPIGDGEVEKYPFHSQRIKDIANYIIENHNADFASYASETGTFDNRQLEVADNWDSEKFKPLDLTKIEQGLRVRDGRHRCLILAVFVMTGKFAYQNVTGEITDHQNYVDTFDYDSFFRDWITVFELDADYQANLRIQFDVAELHNQDLIETLHRYKTQTIAMLREVSEQTQSRIMPLKIVGSCHEVSKYSERVDITAI